MQNKNTLDGNEMWQPSSKSIGRLIALAESDDELGTVLRAHLLTEEILNGIIEF
jgi:hypothetical protein